MAQKLPRWTRHTAASVFLLAATFTLVPKGARAQSSEVEITSQLKGKPLFLRGLWRQDDLRFTHDGKPMQTYAAGPFTLAGIDVEKVSFAHEALEIRGRRVGIEYQKGTPHRVRLGWKDYNGKVLVHIAGHPGEDFSPALAAIFAPDLQTLVPSVEGYWARLSKIYLLDADLDQAVDEAANQSIEDAVGAGSAASEGSPTAPASGGPPPSAAQSTTKLTHIGGSVRPPVLMSQVDPTFSEAARGMRYSGQVRVYLWLETTGVPSHLRVVRAAGMGLDEQAVAAVAAYRFKPAMMNGQPVKVDLFVDVNFQIF